MEMRAWTLAHQAVEARLDWVQGLGPPPDDPGHRARWLRDISTIAAYRDRWRITRQETLGGRNDHKSTEQAIEFQRGLSAAAHARAITYEVAANQMSATHDVETRSRARSGPMSKS